MPELPEVETTRRGIAPYLQGQRVSRVIVRERRLRWPIPEDLDVRLSGQRIESVERRVKEREVFDAEQASSDSARREELKGWIRRLEAGDVPVELARSWAKLTAAERKAYLAERSKNR